MTRQDLLDAVPNPEGIDAILINRCYDVLIELKRFSEQAPVEPFYLEEITRENNEKRTRNMFWADYSTLYKIAIQLLSELNLTPKSRKAALSSTSSGIPKLG